MTAIKTNKFSGGIGLSDPDGLAKDLREIADDLAAVQAPAIAAAAIAAVAQAAPVITAVLDATSVATADLSLNGVIDGGFTQDPSTPSSQAGDPGGFTDWNVNTPQTSLIINSVASVLAAASDFDVSSGVKILEIGQAVYAWLIAVEAAGVISRSVVLGTAAVSGSEAIPSDADINTAVGHSNWIKLSLLHAHRDADASVITTHNFAHLQTYCGTEAGLVNEVKSSANELVALANDIKSKYNAAVLAIVELQALAGTLRTLANEVRSDLNAINAATIKTTRG